ncbi:hypothetical protein ACJJTC_009634 [Scirpophaga incertulas]
MSEDSESPSGEEGDSDMTDIHESLIEKIIISVQKRPALYNKNLKEYSNPIIKTNLWAEVCIEVFPEWDMLNELLCGDSNAVNKKDIIKSIDTIIHLQAKLNYDLSILPPEVALERENTKQDAAFLTDDMSILPPKVAMETEIEKTVTPEITPRKIKLMKKLEKSTALQNRKKKLAALRSKTWRLQKKTAEMSTVIQELKTRSLINQESADLLSSIDVVNRDFLKKFLCKDSSARKYTPEKIRFNSPLYKS